jgi:hypothetical protein
MYIYTLCRHNLLQHIYINTHIYIHIYSKKERDTAVSPCHFQQTKVITETLPISFQVNPLPISRFLFFEAIPSHLITFVWYS